MLSYKSISEQFFFPNVQLLLHHIKASIQLAGRRNILKPNVLMSKSTAERVNRTSSVQHEWRLKYGVSRNSLAVQQLRLCTFTAEGPAILVGELRSHKPMQHGQKKKAEWDKLLFFRKSLPVHYTKFSFYFFLLWILSIPKSSILQGLTNLWKAFRNHFSTKQPLYYLKHSSGRYKTLLHTVNFLCSEKK